MTTIQVRTPAKTKKAAQKILKELGLDMSTAINVYLVKIIQRKGIPFEFVTENGFTLAEELKILRELEEAKKSKGYASAKELHDAILGK